MTSCGSSGSGTGTAGEDSALGSKTAEPDFGYGEIRGFNFPAWWHDDYLRDGAAQSLERVASTGAGWVAIVPTQYMDSASSSTIAPETDARSATDESVTHIIGRAKDRGLRVMLKPHVDVADDTWRGEIEPADPGEWFDSYRTMIITYARLAEREGVELLCIGNELDSMTGSAFSGEWEEIIADVRRVYDGEIVYGASINSYGNIDFWPLLDYMGLNFYYPLSDAADPSLEELQKGWTDYSGFYDEGQNWLARVEEWQARWRKPVIFTEIGYRSIDYAARTPWDYESPGAYNGDAQARAYQAAFDVLEGRRWLAGIFFWDWSARGDACGPGDTGYSICGKPAEEVVRRNLSRDG